VPVLAAFCVMGLVDNVVINSVSGVITAVVVVLLGESDSRVHPALGSDQ